jgi:hypothetical protein
MDALKIEQSGRLIRISEKSFKKSNSENYQDL